MKAENRRKNSVRVVGVVATMMVEVTGKSQGQRQIEKQEEEEPK